MNVRAIVAGASLLAAIGVIACFGPKIRRAHAPPPPRTTGASDAGVSNELAQADLDDPEVDEVDDARAGRLRVHTSAGFVPFREHGDFSEEALSRGVKATHAQCNRVPTAVWVSTKGDEGECLKYWIAGFGAGPIARAVVFFHGDAWLGPGKTNKSYLDLTDEKLQRMADDTSKKLGVPYIFFARPGTHGSSGDHMQRRRPAESLLISAALDQIKTRHGIKELVLTGQSGGGHVTASLLTLRSDIVCAVPTSSPSSPRIRWLAKGKTKDTTGFADSYEPAEHIDRSLPHHPQLRVFVLGSPNDKNVPWGAQTVLADKLKEVGIPVRVLQGEGGGPDHHSLSNSARAVAGWCAKGMSDDAIVTQAASGLKG
jgi:hypothetical protein